MPIGSGVHHDVNTARDSGDYKFWTDISTCEQWECAQLRHRFPSRVGVQGRHARYTAVHGNQQVEGFGLANLSDHQSSRSHSQRLFDQSSQRDFTATFETRLTCLHGNPVRVLERELEDLLTTDDTFVARDAPQQAIQQGCLTRLSAPRNQHIETTHYSRIEELRRLNGEGAPINEIADMSRAHNKSPNIDRPVSPRNLWNHHM
jgi:hypothetical protein